MANTGRSARIRGAEAPETRGATIHEPAEDCGRLDLTHAKASLGRLWAWLTNSGYRPELHYMRGGRTPGVRLAGRATPACAPPVLSTAPGNPEADRCRPDPLRPPLDRAADTPLRRALRACRGQFLLVGLFSGAVNLLQLTTSIYMMQVFDRVLATRVVDTLLWLSLIAGAAVLVLALLEAARGQIMQRVAAWVENRVAPEGFVRAIESTLRGRPYRMEALRDLAVCRGFLGSPGALSLYDVPWVPIYIAVIFLLHPVMGWIALGRRAGAVRPDARHRVLHLQAAASEANTAAMASQRRADAISRNAEVIDSMGMLPSVIGRWRDSVAAMAAPQQRAADRAAILVAATKFFRLGGADRRSSASAPTSCCRWS